MSSSEIISRISELGLGYSIRDAIEYFRERDCYNYWSEQLRYLLFRYEEHLAKVAGQNFENDQWNHIWMATTADSIGHILPQSSGDDGYMHRLGNLLILPPKLNSQLGAKSPTEKATEYNKTSLYHVEEVVDLLPNWGQEAIDQRCDALYAWAIAEWSD